MTKLSPPMSRFSIILLYRRSRMLSSLSCVLLSAMSSLCSSLLSTLSAGNSTVIWFLSCVPERTFFRSVAYISRSSVSISSTGISIFATTSPAAFT